MSARLIAILYLLPMHTYAEQWIKLTSQNFEMYTTNGERTARDAIQHFEQVRSFFTKAMKLNVTSQQKIRIIAFRNEKEYKPFKFNDFAFAYYQRGYDTDYIVMQQINAQYYPTVIHEYVHFLIRNSGIVDIPVWLNEGLADFYSTMQPMGKKVQVGSFIPGRLVQLRDKPLSIETLLSVDHKSPAYNEKDRAGTFYAMSWLLVHMLSLGEEYRDKFPQFLQAIVTTKPPTKAFEDVYEKTPKRVESELLKYARSERITVALFDVKLEKAAESPVIEPADPFEVEINQARVLAVNPQNQESKQRLEAVVKSHPERWQGHEALAYLNYYSSRPEEAYRHFRTAAEKGSTNGRMYLDYANTARRVGMKNDELIPILSKALEHNPGELGARVELASAYYNAKQYKEAMTTLTPVRRVDKKDAYYFFQLWTYTNIRLGQMEEAKRSAARTAQYAETDEQKKQTNELLQYLNRPEPQVTASAGRTPGRPVRLDEDEPRPVIRRAETPRLPGEEPVAAEFPRMEGLLGQIDCLDQRARVHLNVNGRAVAFAILDPSKVVMQGTGAATVEFTCGKQKGQPVAVEFDPTPNEELKTVGNIRAIEFH